MGTIDLLIGPVFFTVAIIIGYWLSSKTSDHNVRSTFRYGLLLKLIGAVAISVIYHTIYRGDTNQYHRAALILNSSMYDNPTIWLKLMLSSGEYDPDTFQYASRIIWYRSGEMVIIKIAAFFGLFCFGSYLGISFLFALFSFSGLWVWYLTVAKLYPEFGLRMGWIYFYVPSIFFWGSGLLKDSLVIGAIGWMFYGFYSIFIVRKRLASSIVLFLLMALFLKSIRIFMLAAFLAPALVWVILENVKRVKSGIIRYTLLPFALFIGVTIGVYLINDLTEGSTRYDPDAFGERAKISANYLYRISEIQGGSGYYLGNLDGTFQGTLRYAPEAIWVSLFRPYLWEINNPMMLLSAIESLALLLFFLNVVRVAGVGGFIKRITTEPYVLFALTFTIVFAFAIGITTYNFGTLVRYKIPLIPFFLTALIIIKKKSLKVRHS